MLYCAQGSIFFENTCAFCPEYGVLKNWYRFANIFVFIQIKKLIDDILCLLPFLLLCGDITLYFLLPLSCQLTWLFMLSKITWTIIYILFREMYSYTIFLFFFLSAKTVTQGFMYTSKHSTNHLYFSTEI